MSCGDTSCFDGQCVRLGHDQHDGISRTDDFAEGVHRELMDDAVLRGADIDALELVFGGHLALDEFAKPAVKLAQFLRHLAAEVLIDLEDLKLDFADLAAGLRHRKHGLRALAVQSCGFAFERDQPVDLHEVLVPKRTDTFELALDQLDLLCFGLLQREVTLDLFSKLGGALPELRFLADAAHRAAARTACVLPP